MKNHNIQGILFDYGGTLDSGGENWGHVLYETYSATGTIIDRSVFWKAYVAVERELEAEQLILPDHTFLDTLRIKVTRQFRQLLAQGVPIDTQSKDHIIMHAYRRAECYVRQSAAVLEILHKTYPMVIVSNFYGNLHTVLREFQICDYFLHVVESAVAGIRKPDERLFKLGIEALGIEAGHCLVVGDSYTNDIVPGKACGCTTVWYNVEHNDEFAPIKDPAPVDYEIHTLEALPDMLR